MAENKTITLAIIKTMLGHVKTYVTKSIAAIPAYVLPKATSSVLGGVMQGSNVSIASDGKISVPVATSSVKGVAAFGSGLKVENGVVSTDIDLSIYEVVSALPTSGQKNNKIYLVADASAPEGNKFKEYAYVNNAWELLGEYKAAIDMTPYLTKTEAASTYQPILTYATDAEVNAICKEVLGLTDADLAA